MKISAQEEYGLRCLLQLGRAEEEKGLTVKEIAQREGLSTAYVEKLLRGLGRGGLVHSVRGTKGGYLLSRHPREIHLNAVVRSLGKVETTGEICDRFPGHLNTCVHIDNCCIRSAWATLTDAIESFLEKTTLADLVGSEIKSRVLFAERMAQPKRGLTV